MNTQQTPQVQQTAAPVTNVPLLSSLQQGTDEAVRQVALLGYN